jgi:cell wall-associated NlpC family hydrolase
MTHWARSYIGKPWAPASDESGPARYSCWGLVRAVFKARHGIDLPPVAVDQMDAMLANARAIKQAVQASGWRPVTGQPADGDVVVLRSPAWLHCGLVVRANGRIGVLHSTHQRGVEWQPWEQAIAGMTPELWRHAA